MRGRDYLTPGVPWGTVAGAGGRTLRGAPQPRLRAAPHPPGRLAV